MAARSSFVLLLLLASCADRAKPSVTLYEAGDYAGAARAADDGLVKFPADRGLAAMRVRAALALGDADGVARTYAALQQAHGNDRELLRDLAIATLDQALGSPSVRLKIAAIEAVEELQLHPLADRVAERLGDDDDRVAAAAAIAVLHGYQQAPQVASDMLKSERPEARRIVVDGLGKKIGALALPDLEAAADDPDARVRSTALRWLGTLGDRNAVAVVKKRMHDEDADVRAAAGLALAKIGIAHEAEVIGDLAADANIALADKQLGVRLAGLELLRAAHRDDRLVELVNDADPRVALEAVVAAPRALVAARAASVLDRARTSKDGPTRAAAANLAPQVVGRPAALPVEQQLAGDADPHVRLAAARALAALGDPQAARAACAAVLAQPEVAVEAAEELAKLGDATGTNALAVMVRDLHATPEQRAAVAAAHREAHVVTAALVAALADPSAIVRVAAARALAGLAR